MEMNKEHGTAAHNNANSDSLKNEQSKQTKKHRIDRQSESSPRNETHKQRNQQAPLCGYNKPWSLIAVCKASIKPSRDRISWDSCDAMSYATATQPFLRKALDSAPVRLYKSKQCTSRHPCHCSPLIDPTGVPAHTVLFEPSRTRQCKTHTVSYSNCTNTREKMNGLSWSSERVQLAHVACSVEPRTLWGHCRRVITLASTPAGQGKAKHHAPPSHHASKIFKARTGPHCF